MRPERRLSGRNGRGGVSRPIKEEPFWRNCVKSRGRRGRARCVSGTRVSWRGAVLKLSRRHVSEGRVKPFLIIDALQKFTNAGAGVVKIAVFVAVDFLLFQRFHE